METQSKSNLTGKKVIIFGASSGIGLAVAKAAAAEGASLTIVSGNRQRINEALMQIPQGTHGHVVNLGHEQNIKHFFEQAGNFDHLIYTAGENISLGDINKTEVDAARQFFNIRYWGAFAVVKYGASHINQGGSVTLTSGIASARPGKGWSVAASICAATEAFTRAMAIELAPIRVNCVMPGVVKTNLWNSMSEADRHNLYQTVGNALPVKQVAEADDIAQTYLYLMKQPYSTGQAIIVDGGGVLV